MNPWKLIQTFENKIRKFLLKYPGLYAILAAISIILFWEGVTEIAGGYHFLTGPVLIVITTPVLAVLGVFLPFFVNDKKLLTELKHEEEKVEKEEVHEEKILEGLSKTIQEMDQEIHEIQEKMHIRK